MCDRRWVAADVPRQRVTCSEVTVVLRVTSFGWRPLRIAHVNRADALVITFYLGTVSFDQADHRRRQDAVERVIEIKGSFKPVKPAKTAA